MIGKVLPVVALAAAFGLATPPAGAASFDCGKAAKPDERAVCADPSLSALDSEMGGLWFAYEQYPLMMGMSGVRHDEAVKFLEERAACGADTGCLTGLYEARIKALKTAVKDGLGDLATTEPAAPALPEGVQKVIDGYAGQCTELGGKLEAGGDQPNILTADLDGDGQADYLLDSQGLQCAGSATAFCANAGCQVDILPSTAGYQPVSAMGGQPTLVQGSKLAEVELWVSKEHCPDLQAGQACWAVYAWQDGKPGLRHEARPQPD
ncbi:lysozyme inhibitor LprI family protein [Geminicoccus roseus]|uniref:lysozyme inhibitor LprI family protein n=1 Tax=Geminicoccus roseus TaxID=404900 RepID=UPI00196A17A7|nr:hypothetical protein [Geminicoccus roseus]